MTIIKLIRTYFVDIFFLIILLIIILGGMMSTGNVSADETNSGITESYDISALMKSMNMSQLPELKTSPDFNLMSIAEEQINLGQQRGKVVLLSFWATW